MLQKIRVNGIELAYRIDGAPRAAPWVVLSHSLACDHAMWDPQMEALRDFRVLRFDTRGHGASEAPVGEYTMDQLAADAHALLDALGIERFHFVGLSMGGMIGQQLALRIPLRMASLTLADTTSRYPAEARPVWEQRIAMVRAQGMDALVPTTLERWFTAAFREQQHRHGGGHRGEDPGDAGGGLHRLCPRDLPHRPDRAAADDRIARPWSSSVPTTRARRRRWPKKSSARSKAHGLEIIPAAAHLSNIEQPARFNALLQKLPGRQQLAFTLTIGASLIGVRGMA